MPGSPPISTSEPSTRPPPRILSISPLPKEIRLSCEESISDRCIGLREAPGTWTSRDEGLAFPVATVSSTIVFHSPQAGHRPIHFGLSFPHDLQNHTVFVFAIFSYAKFDSFAKYETKFIYQFQRPPYRGFGPGRYGSGGLSSPDGSPESRQLRD